MALAAMLTDQSRTLSGAPRRRGALIGNFPPRVCGIATFTQDLLGGLQSASPATKWSLVAMNDHPAEGYAFSGQVSHVLRQEDVNAYITTADLLNSSGAEFAIVQHEFGIFGGPAGAHLLLLLRRLRMPVIVTMHTVLLEPNDEQRRVVDEILSSAAGIVVMAKKGAVILEDVYGADPAMIHVIPHGAPARPLLPTAAFKENLDLSGRKVISTFGLLSPNKGIETIIEALPEVVERHPDAVYVVAGGTHPNLVAREGERYRNGLEKRASELGVSRNLRFINRYLSNEEVIEILQATDVFVTPYLTETQITSGALSYAIALGRPVVSTPYWHAEEALADGVGRLCPFHDSAQFATEINKLLDSPRLRALLSERAWRAGMSSRWLNVGKAYMALARSVVAERASPG